MDIQSEWLQILYALVRIEPFEWGSIGTAIGCGALIGCERQIRGKPVGIRTSALIVVGTYLFLASAFLLQGETIDPTRIIGQVITGIGFLGAGVMLARHGEVIGVTSAATIWMLAALGVLIGLGYRLPAVKLSFLVVIILTGVELLEARLTMLTRGVHRKVDASSARSARIK
ncbi:MgtC/SapB family protein [Amphritea sp.]|uniref:MgtC/SapB family protein n=1 Tax=Amphritea sp. TaxID=1872502 RepID=UPI003A92B1B7